MDTNQPVQPPMQQEVPQTEHKKMNVTWLTIFLLIFAASLATAAAYFFIPRQTDTQNPDMAAAPTSPTPTPAIPWKTYTDEQNRYSFNYPENWKLEEDSSNSAKFVLRYNDTNDSGEITGGFFSRGEFSQFGTVNCKDIPIDLENPCHNYPKTASTAAYLHLTVENNTPTTVTAYVPRQNGVGLAFMITQPNSNSYQTLLTIIETLRLVNEPLIHKFAICPESWSTDRKTLTAHGITFQASEVDEIWIKDNCQ